MSFKTFECDVSGQVFQSIPAEGWNPVGDTLIVSNNTTLLGYFECNPATSKFWGAEPLKGAMTSEEFHELWPYLVVVMFVGYGIKKVHSIFRERYN